LIQSPERIKGVWCGLPWHLDETQTEKDTAWTQGQLAQTDSD